MALLDQYNLATDQEFSRRITAALTNALATIENESPTTTNHTARLQWVNGVKANAVTRVNDLAWGCTTDGAIMTAYTSGTPVASSAVADDDIQRVVTALISANVGV